MNGCKNRINPFVVAGGILVVMIIVFTIISIWLQDRYQKTNASWQEAISRVASSVAAGATLSFIIGLTLLLIPKRDESWYSLSNPNYEGA
jgi:cytochrome bd-type quinol oxidase subunit 2